MSQFVGVAASLALCRQRPVQKLDPAEIVAAGVGGLVAGPLTDAPESLWIRS